MRKFWKYSILQADKIADEIEFFPDMVDTGYGVPESVLRDHLDDDTFVHGRDEASL
jgi:hypothetical protein